MCSGRVNSYDDFIDFCKAIHADEYDPELMAQDYEGFFLRKRLRDNPRQWYNEGFMSEDDFAHILEYWKTQDRPGSSNSLTLSWLLVDEAKFINYEKLKDETLPANGGIKSHFGKHSFNHSIHSCHALMAQKIENQ